MCFKNFNFKSLSLNCSECLVRRFIPSSSSSFVGHKNHIPIGPSSSLFSIYVDIVILGTVSPGLYKIALSFFISSPASGSLCLPSSSIMTLLFAIISIKDSSGYSICIGSNSPSSFASSGVTIDLFLKIEL